MKLTEIGPPAEKEEEVFAEVFADFFRTRSVPPADSAPAFMVAQCHSEGLVKWYERLGWGRMFSESRSYHYEGERWGFDNGAWTACRNGQPFRADAFLRRLERDARRVERIGSPPTVAAVPDMLWAGEASLEFSVRWRERLRREGPDWPWYLPVQDGMTVENVEAVIGKFDGIFLGGSDTVKGNARTWCDLAHSNGAAFHYGRCGTAGKLAHAFAIGADSLDTAGPMMNGAQLHRFLRQWYMLVTRNSEARDEAR